MDTGTKLLTPQEVAARLGVKVDTLRIWRWRRRGPAYVRISSHAVRYHESVINEYIRELAA